MSPSITCLKCGMVSYNPYDQSCARYNTEEEAREGHERAVKNLEAGEVPWFCKEDDV